MTEQETSHVSSAGSTSQPESSSAGVHSDQAQSPGKELEQEPIWIRLEVDAGKHIRLRCMEGNETVREVALNPTGLKALVDLDLMRQPRSLKIGALHNWVEMDGELFRCGHAGNWRWSRFAAMMSAGEACTPQADNSSGHETQTE